MVVTDTTVSGRTVRPPILVPDSFHPLFYVEAVHGVRVESLSTGPRENVVVLWGALEFKSLKLHLNISFSSSEHRGSLHSIVRVSIYPYFLAIDCRLDRHVESTRLQDSAARRAGSIRIEGPDSCCIEKECQQKTIE